MGRVVCARQTRLEQRNRHSGSLRLCEQLQKTGDEIPDVGEDYTLQQPEDIRGRVAFGALPWLMHDQPFVQGLTACAEIGEAMARAVVKPASRARRRLSFD